MNDAGPAAASVRELRVAGEIAQAFLTARKPTEVYRIALERVAPLVGAHFGCVFLREGDSDLLQIVTAFNWPQRYAAYLGTMRVRIGNGPTGRAVLENRLVDAADIFEDFTEWETAQTPILSWLGEHFTHGTGGLPVGLQVIGRSGDDRRTLAVADWIERRLGT